MEARQVTTSLDELMSVPEAAKSLGVTRAWLWRLCKDGRIGRMVAGRYAVTPGEIERYRKTRRQAGRPPSGKKRKEPKR